MAHKGRKGEIFTRIIALILAILMLLGVVGTLVYYIVLN